MARKRTGQAPARRAKKLIVRAEDTAAPRGAGSRSRAGDGIPEAHIEKGGGAVSVQITFGHAQHATYTIQLFDAAGSTELARETGVNTDTEPDRFDLTLTPAQLHRHLVQWSGAVDAFSGGPGQRYSVIFEIIQNGATVPDGRREKSGPLTVTQAFLGVFRLVAS